VVLGVSEFGVMASIDKRRGKWRAQVRRQGHALCKTFQRKGDAEAWVRDVERTIDREGDPTVRAITGKDTFASLIDVHIDDLHAVKKPLRRSKRAVLRRLREELGTTPLNQLTREKLIGYGRARAEQGAGPATLAVDISFIGTVLTHAAAVHGVRVNTEAVTLARVALRRLGLVGKSRERDRRPTTEELQKLFDYYDGNPRQLIPMSRIIKFAIASAMREEEISRIERTTLDAKSRTVIVTDRKDPREKEGNDQRVPLLAATGFDAWQIVQDEITLHPNSKRIFPYNAKSVSASFTRACMKLQILDLHFHDLRHEATSRLFEAGLTIEQVPLVTGHKDWKMLKRYTQLRPEMLYQRLSREAASA
jgi:integrase